MDNISTIIAELKKQLQEITNVISNTVRNDNNCKEIGYWENPLNPNLFAYCFDIILGFNVRYRIAEKVNYFSLCEKASYDKDKF